MCVVSELAKAEPVHVVFPQANVMESECVVAFSVSELGMLIQLLVFMRLTAWSLFTVLVREPILRLFIVQVH